MSRKYPMLAVLLALAASMSPNPASAHHSFAMFDQAKLVTVKGTVKEFQWTNPHVFIELSVPGKTGAVDWTIEGGAPNALARNGWKRNSLKPGDVVEISVHPLRSGANGGAIVSARLPNNVVLKG